MRLVVAHCAPFALWLWRLSQLNSYCSGLFRWHVDHLNTANIQANNKQFFNQKLRLLIVSIASVGWLGNWLISKKYRISISFVIISVSLISRAVIECSGANLNNLPAQKDLLHRKSQFLLANLVFLSEKRIYIITVIPKNSFCETCFECTSK